MIAPATRACGTSASAPAKAAIANVPALSLPSATCTTLSSVLGIAATLALIASTACAVWNVRSDRPCDALSSTTSTTISASALRFSSCKDGLPKATSTNPNASARIAQPTNPRHSAKASSNAAASPKAINAQSATRG